MRLLQRLRNLFLPEGEVSDGFHTFDELYHYRMLYIWGVPWLILGAVLGFITLFIVPAAPLWAFSIGLLLVTTDRLIEVNKYNNERRRISQEA